MESLLPDVHSSLYQSPTLRQHPLRFSQLLRSRSKQARVLVSVFNLNDDI